MHFTTARCIHEGVNVRTLLTEALEREHANQRALVSRNEIPELRYEHRAEMAQLENDLDRDSIKQASVLALLEYQRDRANEIVLALLEFQRDRANDLVQKTRDAMVELWAGS